MQIVLLHIHWKSDEDTSKSNVLFSDGIPGELQPRTDPIEKYPHDPQTATIN
jgi:hypothetical protein